MGIPPNELEQRISARQLAEWRAFERIEGPILLHQRIDMAAAMIGWVVGKVGGAKGLRLQDLLVDWDRREPTEEERARALGAALEVAARQASRP